MINKSLKNFSGIHENIILLGDFNMMIHVEKNLEQLPLCRIIDLWLEIRASEISTTTLQAASNHHETLDSNQHETLDSNQMELY